MKKTLIYTVTILSVAGAAIGCKSFLTTPAPASSIPVLSGAATTNDPATVAYLKLAGQINAFANPTPTEPLIATALTALTALASAAAGFAARHYTITPTVPSASTTTTGI